MYSSNYIFQQLHFFPMTETTTTNNHICSPERAERLYQCWHWGIAVCRCPRPTCGTGLARCLSVSASNPWHWLGSLSVVSASNQRHWLDTLFVGVRVQPMALAWLVVCWCPRPTCGTGLARCLSVSASNLWHWLGPLSVGVRVQPVALAWLAVCRCPRPTSGTGLVRNEQNKLKRAVYPN